MVSITKNKRTQTTYVKERNVRRAEGDRYVYFMFHTFFGFLLFILIGTKFDFFSIQSGLVEDIFSVEFLIVLIIIMAVSFLTGMFGRVLAYYLVRGIYKNSATRNFIEINSIGINRIGVRYLLDLFLSSLIFAAGAVIIIQRKIFGIEDETFYMILTYLIIRICLYAITKAIMWKKG